MSKISWKEFDEKHGFKDFAEKFESFENMLYDGKWVPFGIANVLYLFYGGAHFSSENEGVALYPCCRGHLHIHFFKIKKYKEKKMMKLTGERKIIIDKESKLNLKQIIEKLKSKNLTKEQLKEELTKNKDELSYLG